MKLKTLELKNFGSHRETKIDFESERISEAPIVIITGNTGAGKSTLLDAISFALYEQIFRYNSKEIKDIKSYNSQDTETSVTLKIESKGKEYEIKRIIDKNNNISINVSESSQIKYSNKKTELDKKITQIIGCDYKLFSKSVVLPQGQFAALLKTDKPEERREIIQKIFPEIEIYKLIKEKIDQKLKEVKDTFNTLNQKIETTKKQFSDEISTISSSISNLIPQNEIKKIQNLQISKPEEIENTKNEIINYLNEKTTELISQKNTLQKQKDEKNTEKTKLEKDLQQIQGINQIKTEINTTLKEIETKVNNLLKIPSVDSQNIPLIESKTSEMLSEITQKLKEIQNLRDKYNKSKIEFENLKRSFNQLKDQIKNRTKEIVGKELKNREEILKEIENINKSLLEIQTQIQKISSQNLEEEEKKLAVIQEKIKQRNELENQIKNSQNQINNLDKEINKISEKLKTIENLLAEKSKYEIQIFAEKIRETLKDGQTCPVCGNIYHPDQPTEIIGFKLITDSDFKTLQYISNTPKQKPKETEEISKISKEIENLKNQQKDLEIKKVSLETEKQNIQNNIKSFEEKLNSIQEELETEGIKSEEEFNEKLQKISSLKTELENLKNQEKEINDKISKLKTLYNVVEDSYNNQIKPRKEELEKYTEELQETPLFKTIFPKFQPQQGKISVYFDREISEGIESYLEEIETKKNTLEEIIKSIDKIKTLQNSLNQITTNILQDEITIKNNIKEITEEITKIDEEIKKLETQNSEINQKTGEINTRFDILKNLASDFITTNQELEKISKEYDTLKKLDEKFDTQTIVNFVIKIKMDDIIKTANNYLKMLGIEDKKLFVNFEERNPSFSVKYSDADITKPVNSLSGGESFLFSIALAFSIAKDIVDNLHINSLFIDEGFDTLDENYNSRVFFFLESFAKEKNVTIYIITHKQEIFENTNFPKIEVFKENGVSKVKIISKKINQESLTNN